MISLKCFLAVVAVVVVVVVVVVFVVVLYESKEEFRVMVTAGKASRAQMAISTCFSLMRVSLLNENHTLVGLMKRTQHKVGVLSVTWLLGDPLKRHIARRREIATG